MKLSYYKNLSFLIITLLFVSHSCLKENLKPVAHFEVNSKICYSGRMLTFDGSSSTNSDGESFLLKGRWDFNNDGQWETDFNSDLRVNRIFTESGNYNVRLEVVDQNGLTDQFEDSLKILGPLADSVIIDPRDGNKYKIVRVGGVWIMAENLRFGTLISTSEKQKDNRIAEYYAFDNNPVNVPVYGGLYLWEEAMNWNRQTNNQGICPPGWRIPEISDWYRVDIKVSHAFLSDYYGPTGLSGLDLQYSGGYLDGPVNLPGFEGSHFMGGSSGAYWFNYKNKMPSGMRVYGWVGFWKYPNSHEDLWNLKGLQFNKASYDIRDDNGEIVFIDSFLSVRCVKDLP